ncbi:MAG: hypothetical protein WD278_12245, partial [Pirellulales bacterium]
MVFGTLALQAAAGRAAPPDPSGPESNRPGGASQTSPGDGVIDLGTRKAGHDWPAFLGPTGDSKSAETGIVTQWPPEGPRLVWQQ